MTVVNYVSAGEMKKRTGLKALGYAFPKDDEILIRKDLPEKKKKEVLAHEAEHIEKGEEGPFLNFLLPAVGAVGGALLSSRSADKAADAQVDASNQQIAFSRESRDLARADQAPYREAGYTALDALMSMTGLAAPNRPAPSQPRSTGDSMIPGGGDAFRYNRSVIDEYGGYGRRAMGMTRGAATRNSQFVARYAGGPTGYGGRQYVMNEEGPENYYSGGAVTRNANPVTVDGQTGYVEPNENPGGVEGGFNFQTDPGYQFRRGEGMRVLERSAAAKGGLLSGGFARKAMRYGQDYASAEYANVYNRIANIAGLGQVSANASGSAALQTGLQMGNAASNAGAARASGYVAQGNALATGINQLSQLPWGKVFKRGGNGGYDPTDFGTDPGGWGYV